MKHAFFLSAAAAGLCMLTVVFSPLYATAAPHKQTGSQAQQAQEPRKQAYAAPSPLLNAGSPKALPSTTHPRPAGNVPADTPMSPEAFAAEEDAYRRILQSDPDVLHVRAQKGDLDAVHALGMRYILYGTDDPQNNARGGALLRQAAEAGHVQAQLDYAGWFSLQKSMADPADARARQSYQTQMLFWLEKAGENPAATPRQQRAAWTALGSAWENENVPESKEKAAYWYQCCVNKGFAGSEAVLGSLYAKTAAGNIHDHQAALFWLSAAFDKGDNSVLYRLGMLYSINSGATDRAKAYFWLSLALKEAFAERNKAEAAAPEGSAPHRATLAADGHVKNILHARDALEAMMAEEELDDADEYLRVYYTLGRAPAIMP